MKSNLPFGAVGPGSELEQSSSSTSSKSATIENGQQEMLSTPKGETRSAVCTQPLGKLSCLSEQNCPSGVAERNRLFRRPPQVYLFIYFSILFKENHFLPNGMTSEYLRSRFSSSKRQLRDLNTLSSRKAGFIFGWPCHNLDS
jgi:hypothetical protein